MQAKKNGNYLLRNLRSERGKCKFMYKPHINRKIYPGEFVERIKQTANERNGFDRV